MPQWPNGLPLRGISNMRRALVTGGCGFVGSHLVEGLLKRDWNVRVLDDFSTGTMDNFASRDARVEIVEGSVADREMAATVCRDVDVVFHEAALASVTRSVDDPLATHEACATGTLVMLNAARLAGVKRFVYAASSSAYGDQQEPQKHEGLLARTLSPYAAAKLAGENYCQAFFHSYGFETVCLRYFNVFGPRQDPNGPYAAVIPRFISALAQDEAPVIYGDGNQTRDFTFIENVVQANIQAATVANTAGETFNIAAGKATSLLDLLEMIARVMGKRIPPRFEPERVGDVRHSLADISKAQHCLGYEPKVTLEAGLVPTIAWYTR